MPYEKQNWDNLPSKTTPLSAGRLNHLEDGVADAHAELEGRLSPDEMASFGRKPSPSEKVLFVTPRGSDTNDGLTLSTAKATIFSALEALGSTPGTIQLGVGIFSTAQTHGLPTGVTVRGSGRGATTVNYTGTGALFTTAAPGVRSYNQMLTGFSMTGPGKTSSAVAVNLSDISNARISDFTMNGFGTGVLNSSTLLGGARSTSASLMASSTRAALASPSARRGQMALAFVT